MQWRRADENPYGFTFNVHTTLPATASSDATTTLVDDNDDAGADACVDILGVHSSFIACTISSKKGYRTPHSNLGETKTGNFANKI